MTAAKNTLPRVALVFLALLFFALEPIGALSGTIYIDVADMDQPAIWVASGGWGGSGVTQTGDESYSLSAGVVGAHRAWPSSPSRVIFTNEVDGSTVFGLRLASVSWSELYWEARYYFELYTADASGIYSGPDWSTFDVASLTDDGTWQLVYSGLRTNLDTFNIYVRGPGPSPVPEPMVSPSYEFSVQHYNQTTESIQLFNHDEVSRSVTLNILNPHSEQPEQLEEPTIYLQSANPLMIAPGETADISLLIDAVDAGIYEGFLLEVAVDDGSTFYSNITVYVTEGDPQELPDLAVSSEDIGFASENPGDPVTTLTANVHNRGQSSASNIEVDFYELDTFLGSEVIDTIAADGTAAASISIPTLSDGDHLIRVVVDPADAIEELEEANNEASQIIRPAGTPGPTEGHILVTGSLPSRVYTEALFRLTGRAVYDITVGGVRYTDYVVKGGSVDVTIRAEDGTEWVYGGIHTDVNGNFTKSLLAPSIPGIYRLFMAVTDKTFVGTRELVFTAVERPAVEPPPPPPPLSPSSGGSGYWTLEGGVWSWTWTSLPSSGPVPESDMWVFSEDLYFSKDNPAAGEEITVFAEIHYWATSTALVAEDIPVNLYVISPGEPKERIGQTTIASLSVAAPENGSRYVYATWKNPGDGIYLLEVEIDPSYVEDNLLNNAATRAIIVGQLASNQGAISGRVTDAWGGVGNVILNGFDFNGQSLGSTVTDDTGFYLFESIPAGEAEVRIETPAGYIADADTKTVNVEANSVTQDVNFYLTELTDTEPPVLSLPDDITAEATGPSGAIVSYEATATDAVDGDLTPTCEPASGGTFALGTTPVTCTATDAAGNSASGSFTVTVLDTTPPAVTPPADVTVEATGVQTAVDIGMATATDAVGVVSIGSDAPATYPVGTTTVTWTATDAAGNAGTATQTVTVVDTTPPTVTVPADLTVSTSDPSGASVSYNASATDIVDGDLIPTCTPASGSLFPLGTTAVTCSATDSAGNTGSATFTVTVEQTVADTTAPACSLQAVNQGPPVSIEVFTQDSESGLDHVAVLVADNASVEIPPFTPGTTEPLIVIGTKLDQSQSSHLTLEVFDVAGTSVVCDPVTMLVIRATGKPVSETLANVPEQERIVVVSNGDPGLKNLDVVVNGTKFKITGLADREATSLDVADAMVPGNDNTFVLTARGKPGSGAVVTIRD